MGGGGIESQKVPETLGFGDEVQLFNFGPALDLCFSFQRLGSGRKRFSVDHFNGRVVACETRGFFLVFLETSLGILRDACVKKIILTEQDVRVPH